MKNNDKNLHNKHRNRLCTRFLTEKFDSWPPHNIMEYILFFVIPRKDTNEIAHLLLEKFGTVGEIFMASTEELVKVPGIGKKTAKFLTSFPQLIDDYLVSFGEIVEEFKSYREVLGFIDNFAKIHAHINSTYLFLFHTEYELVNIKQLTNIYSNGKLDISEVLMNIKSVLADSILILQLSQEDSFSDYYYLNEDNLCLLQKQLDVMDINLIDVVYYYDRINLLKSCEDIQNECDNIIKTK